MTIDPTKTDMLPLSPPDDDPPRLCVCGIRWYQDEVEPFDYCPECGAQMDVGTIVYRETEEEEE